MKASESSNAGDKNSHPTAPVLVSYHLMVQGRYFPPENPDEKRGFWQINLG
jgi:hypothetical protein